MSESHLRACRKFRSRESYLVLLPLPVVSLLLGVEDNVKLEKSQALQFNIYY